MVIRRAKKDVKRAKDARKAKDIKATGYLDSLETPKRRIFIDQNTGHNLIGA